MAGAVTFLLFSLFSIDGFSAVYTKDYHEHRDHPVMRDFQASKGGKAEKKPTLDITNKKAIQERMLNSFHYFDQAEGSFRYYSREVGFDFFVSYKLDMKDNHIKFYTKEMNSQLKPLFEASFINGKETRLYHDFHAYEVMEQDINHKGEFKSIASVYGMVDGQKMYDYPSTPIQIGLANNSLHGKEVAAGFLEEQEKWEVIGTEDYLGRDAVLINGKFGKAYSHKNWGSFQIWMDKHTGILLKYHIYDVNGQILDALVTNEITVNKAVHIESINPKLYSIYQQYEKVDRIEMLGLREGEAL